MARLYGGASGGGGGAITGSGVAGQVTYWDGATVIAGDVNFLWDKTNFNFVAGQGNTVAGFQNITSGKNNVVNAGYVAVFGLSNQVYGLSNIVAGEQNKNIQSDPEFAGNYNAVFGVNNHYHDVSDKNIIGGEANEITGSLNVVGGSSNTVAGDKNAVFGNGHSISTNQNLVGGLQHTLTGGDQNLVGGTNNTTSGGACIIGGSVNNNSGNFGIVGGRENIVTAEYSFIHGYRGKSSNYGQAAHASGYFAVKGDAQTSDLVARLLTTGDTPTELFLDGDTTYLALENYKVYGFKATIVCASASTGAKRAMYCLKWHTFRGVDASTTTVDGLVVETIYESDAGLDATVTADTTNGRPAIKVTGIAATNIRWVAKIEMTEVGIDTSI